MNFIQGQKFKSLADFIFAPANDVPRNDYCYLSNTLDKRLIKSGSIIYTHSFYAKQLFKYLSEVDKEVFVITHNSDLNIDFPPPDNVLMWYTQNVNLKHERIRSIPIGLENDCWYPEKKTMLFEKLKFPKVYKNMLYMNHNTGTNPARIRPYEILEDKSWVTAERGQNGRGISDYLDNVYNHPFVICPEGNGMDTHRVWECLYLRTIPIEKRNINNQFYTDLPICFVDDWNEITEEFLFKEFKRMAAVKWNLAKLDFNYWKDEIQNRRKHN